MFFSFSHDVPHRIEFFGNEIESIRSFDLETQLSIETSKSIQILPNVELKNLEIERESLITFLGEKTLVVADRLQLICDRLDGLFEKANINFSNTNTDIKYSKPEQLFCDSSSFIKDFKNPKIGRSERYSRTIF